jgi:hypothetical protein
LCRVHVHGAIYPTIDCTVPTRKQFNKGIVLVLVLDTVSAFVVRSTTCKDAVRTYYGTYAFLEAAQ